MAEQTAEQEQVAENEQTEQKSGTEVQEVELGEASEQAGTAAGGIDLLVDITMSVTVRLGNAQVPVKRLLQLGPGSVLQLDKNVNEPAELYVQDVKFATGDIVTVDDCFAIRIREVVGI